MAAAMIASPANRFGRVALRIHDVTHPHWRRDLRSSCHARGRPAPFVTLPKPQGVKDVQIQIAGLREIEAAHGVARPIPVHVLIETRWCAAPGLGYRRSPVSRARTSDSWTLFPATTVPFPGGR